MTSRRSKKNAFVQLLQQIDIVRYEQLRNLDPLEVRRRTDRQNRMSQLLASIPDTNFFVELINLSNHGIQGVITVHNLLDLPGDDDTPAWGTSDRTAFPTVSTEEASAEEASAEEEAADGDLPGIDDTTPWGAEDDEEDDSYQQEAY